jgi:hypothetical protein
MRKLIRTCFESPKYCLYAHVPSDLQYAKMHQNFILTIRGDNLYLFHDHVPGGLEERGNASEPVKKFLFDDYVPGCLIVCGNASELVFNNSSR